MTADEEEDLEREKERARFAHYCGVPAVLQESSLHFFVEVEEMIVSFGAGQAQRFSVY